MLQGGLEPIWGILARRNGRALHYLRRLLGQLLQALRMERHAVLMVDTPFLFGQYQTRMGFFVNVLSTAKLAWLWSRSF